MICTAKYDAAVDLWSVGVILYGGYTQLGHHCFCNNDVQREQIIIEGLLARETYVAIPLRFFKLLRIR